MDHDLAIQLAIYRTTAEQGRPPSATDLAARLGMEHARVRDAFARLMQRRLLLLEPDGESIRMAPPFSGVPTQHRVRVGEVDYFANCAWDALGIPAALHRAGVITSRCEQSHEPLELRIGLDGPGASDWLFHCQVPAPHWWQDLVYT